MSIIKNLNPVFIEKTKDGDRVYDISSRLIKDRVIYLDCEIDSEVSSQIVALLFLLDREDSEKPISLWLSSPGGDVSGFFAIYDMMSRIKAPVKTVCIGEVCSAAAFLLASGTPGKRFAMPNSRIMIHQIQVSGIGGSNAELEVSTKELKVVQENLTEILARHTGHTKAKIKRDTKLDRFMSAIEAKDYGLIDNILPISKKQLPLLTKESTKSVNIKETLVKESNQDDDE